MMTHQKLNVYQRYPGSNNDLFLHMASDEERKLLTTEDWMLTYFYFDNMSLAQQGQLTEQDLAAVEDHVLKNCESQEVATRFKSVIIYQLNKEIPLVKRLIHWLLSLKKSIN
jgi:hypothetical protein